MKISMAHFGARARRDALHHEQNIDVAEALKQYEEENDEKLSISEKRDFYKGWRIGLITYVIEDMRIFLKYANADELEWLGEELWELARKHSLAKSDRELHESLANANPSQERSHEQ